LHAGYSEGARWGE
jgi:hypothetical protein